MARGGAKGGSPKTDAKVGVKREDGYLYFIDKDGDVSAAKMVRGGSKKKAAKKPAAKKPAAKKAVKKPAKKAAKRK